MKSSKSFIMNKQELWSALRAPTEKSCDNCINLDNNHQCDMYHQDLCCNPGTRSGIPSIAGYTYGVRWEWNGKK